LIPSPIRRVLSSIQTHQVQALLMGGQACVLYGAAEFSRDTDLAILAAAENLQRLQNALAELQAERIAVPPFELRYLEMGLAVHFRCRLADCAGMRIDIMSKMRGVAAFSELWARRTTIESDQGSLDLLSLPDLVQAKKTQRDKDWPVIARLVEASYFHQRLKPTPSLAEFWLRELRTPQLLIDVACEHAAQAQALSGHRAAVAAALGGYQALATVARDFQAEQDQEREADRQYWQPLKKELERLRRDARLG